MRHPRVGLDGLLGGRGRIAWRSRPSGAIVESYRFGLLDDWSRRWWPQGVDVRPAASEDATARPVLAVSWFAHPRRGVGQGARLSFVELRGRTARYHHVLLVDPVADADASGGPGDSGGADDAGVRLDPVPVHAGGVAWAGDRIYVAATRGGVREFRTADILRLDRRAARRGGAARAPFGYRHVLPQHARHDAVAEGGELLRYSFVSHENVAGASHLVAGEYSDGGTGGDAAFNGGTASSGGTAPAAAPTRRLVRVPLDDDGAFRIDGDLATAAEVHETDIDRMQGALVVDGTWFLTASRGEHAGGDLLVGAPGRWVRHRGILPPGPEDLALWRSRRQLWSVCEWPGRRRLFALPLDRYLPS